MSARKILSDTADTAVYCVKSTFDFFVDHAKTYSISDLGQVKVLSEKIKHLTAVLDFLEAYSMSFPGLKELYSCSKLTKKTISIYHCLPQLLDDTYKAVNRVVYATKSSAEQSAILTNKDLSKEVGIESSIKSGLFVVADKISSLFCNFLSGLKEFLSISGAYVKDAAGIAKDLSPVLERLGAICGALSFVDAAYDYSKPFDFKKEEFTSVETYNRKYNLTLASKLLKLADSIMKLSMALIPFIKVYSACLPVVAASAVVSPALIPTITVVSIAVGLVAKYIKKHADSTIADKKAKEATSVLPGSGPDEASGSVLRPLGEVARSRSDTASSNFSRHSGEGGGSPGSPSSHASGSSATGSVEALLATGND
jgi:hypothetical protein